MREDKALGSGVTWVLSYYSNSGRFSLWPLLAALDRTHREKEKLKAMDVTLRRQWPVRKAWWQL